MKKRLLQIVMSVALIWLLVTWTDFKQVREHLAGCNYYYFGLALCIVTLNRFIMSYKWNLLLRALDIRLHWWEPLKIYYIANFLGLFLPPTIGVDVIRTYLTSKLHHDKAKIISSILVERIIGMVCIFFVGAMGLIYFIINYSTQGNNFSGFLITSSSLFVIFLVGFLLSLNRRFSRLILSLLSTGSQNRLLRKGKQQLHHFFSTYITYHNQQKYLIVFVLLTLLEIFTVVVWGYVSALALNAAIPFSYFLAVVPIVIVLIRIPISIAGFGVYEGGFAYFLSMLGYSKSIGFSIGILDHIVVLVALLPGIFFLLMSRERKMLLRATKQKNPPEI